MAIPVILMAASAAVSAYGAVKSGRDQAYMADAAAKANAYNAAVMKQNADATRATYRAREEQLRRTNRIEEGKRLAAIAQSGTGEGGSNAAFESQQETLSELDALNVRYEGELSARNLESGSSLQSYNATLNRRAAGNYNTSGFIGAAGSILSGASRAYGYGRTGGYGYGGYGLGNYNPGGY